MQIAPERITLGTFVKMLCTENYPVLTFSRITLQSKFQQMKLLALLKQTLNIEYIVMKPTLPKNTTATSEELFPLSDSATRYNQWIMSLNKAKLIPKERILPTLTIDTPNSHRNMMLEKSNMSEKYLSEIKKSVNELSPWGYSIFLGDDLYTANKDFSERFLFRTALINGATQEIAKSELSNLTILDMACNHGYFGLEMAYLGAKHAYGYDLREINIKKARLLQEHFNIKNATFGVSDVYEITESFDIVYNLGLLYHVTDPYELVRLTYDLCRKFAVIDTITHHSPLSAFIQRTNKNSSHHAEGKYNVEYHPTYRGLIDLMHAVGFKNIVEVVSSEVEGSATNHLYDRLERRCLIGFK